MEQEGEKIIYSKRFAYYLKGIGLEPLRIERNPRHPEFFVWVYQDTPALQCAMSLYTVIISQNKK